MLLACDNYILKKLWFAELGYLMDVELEEGSIHSQTESVISEQDEDNGLLLEQNLGNIFLLESFQLFLLL